MFESGTVDIEPSSLDKVIAISAGDSIYVTSALFCDFGTRVHSYRVEKIVGNIPSRS